MTWTIPTPTDLAGRAAGVFEQAFPGADARGPNSVLATIARVTGLSVYDAYLYQARLAQELMPDTAVDWLADHAATWGVPRLAAVPAQLALSFTGGSGALPAGTTLTSAGGQTYTLNAAVTLGGVAAGVATASTAGIIGNLPAGAALALASPVDGLANQAGVVTGTNVAGVDIEALENWRARILLRIRTPAMGGAASDYVTWAQQAAPGAIVAVKPGWVGNGTVGLVVAMPGPAVPSSGQLATIASYVQTMKPVTSQLVTLAASLHPVDVTLHISPDTVAVRNATLAALALFFQQDAAIGGTIYASRLDDAISSASGEYSHQRTAPAGDVVMGATEIPVLGTVTFT